MSPFLTSRKCVNVLIVCISLLAEADAGHTEFMDEVFQNETRFPGGEWKAASEPFTDVVSATHSWRAGFRFVVFGVYVYVHVYI